MTWDDFDRWSPVSLRGAAAQLVASGLLSEPEASARAAGQLAEQLPVGIATPLHHLWAVHSTGPEGFVVGHLWMRVRPSAHQVEAFVLDIEILPEVRGRGWGRAAMLAAEQAARDAGASVVRLNVFSHNSAGVRLYEGLGYDVVGATLLRRLDARPPATPTGMVPVDLRPMDTDVHAGSEPLGWQALDGTELVADVWMRLARRSDGVHAFIPELRPHHLDRLPAVVVAVEQLCRGLDVRSVMVSVPESLPLHPAAGQALVERCGFDVAAQTMAKVI